ncbi:chromosome segregation protein SMC [Alkalihalobacterium chitinilyticum]|uniref:Chromosome partition protein Smc n=1 Tax=Alkalihalobacterium chitinilyticum TaxID=2980103 RepID=A0ABT5VC17_9BACI|nr:chromosome segregation protein SMC [Alkalihalobacterium chitinilyticum]MDE5412998.1 chromosome segregation protein SMC [Alkalihalobacterium chitinilyticum]
MFLKRFEVMGFKSFADRMTVEFDSGVTAVVGPNGSGKSNISDGIRWVLGEQSAKSLRGSKMEDIIFAGSDTRKPLNFAEITLVLDNQDQHLAIDYTEVSVTRRVYRSGESEYQLNKQTCRLKDIVDLFMDSGLGKEAFSIIGQGKVEEILSSKAEDRRVIFEEAAGVLKYKTRKLKAEKKLWETQENLNRVEDILHELEGQIEPLRIQSSIAKDYLQKKEELKEVEVALMVYEITDLHEKWTKAQEQLQSLEQRRDELSYKIKDKEITTEKLQSELRQLDTSLNELQDELLQASEALEKSEGQKEVLKERKKNFHYNRDQLLKTINELKEKKQLLDKTLASEKEVLRKLEREFQTKTTELLDRQERLALAQEDLEGELDRLKSDYIEIVNEQASIRNEIRYLEDQVASTKRKEKILVDDNDQLLQLRKQVLDKKGEYELLVQTRQKELHEKVDQFRALEAKIEKLNKEYDTRQSQLYEAFRLIQQVKSRKDVIEEMQADFSGFFQGVKEVLKARDRNLQGIVGAVAELINVPKQYETAIEIALGGATQHVVVESEGAGRQAITFLKKNGFGRATFLPLPVIKGRTIRGDLIHQINSHEAFIGIASQLVGYDGRYEQIMGNLLGHVIIAKNLEGANDLARKIGYSYRIVTLDGDVVNPGGSMTGGAIKQKSTPLLGRQRELEDLTEKLTGMEEKTIKLETYVKELKQQLQKSETMLQEQREAGETARELEREARNLLREVELEEKSVNDRLALFDREQAMLTKDEDAAVRRLEALSTELKQSAATTSLLESQVKEIEAKQKLQQTSKETMQDELTDLKVHIAKEEERLANQRDKVERLVHEVEEIGTVLRDNEEQYWLLENEMSDSTNGEGHLEMKIEASRKKKDDTITIISNLRQERTEKQQSLDGLEVTLKVEKGHLKLVLDEFHQCEVQKNRYDVQLDNLLSHLREEYELSYEAAQDEHPLLMPAEEAKTKVKLIKLAIEELGTVNLGAIEEYDRVSERHQFLHEQKEDLVMAKENLFNVIMEMDEEMTRRFKETFDQISAHFKVVFKQLFGGGHADLVLTNPDQLLTTGVEIMARPPGKKLQNLALLSGGERALTAIALLFSILKVRPVPFCVLDEVEAALDEANVNRFASYLKAFSGQTQFIVITHRKGTMEEADVLYGVTMQESGVSKLVSVKLEETKELVES